MKNDISPNIKKSHNRIADSYGISPPGIGVKRNSYNAWNFEHNAVKPLSRIINQYWQNAQILDAGCGNGQIAEILLNNGVKSVIGVDFSQNMLINALKRFQNSDLYDRYSPVKADLESLSMLKNNIFDGAILFGVLEHLDNPDLVFKNIFQTLKKNAVFVVAVPRRGSLTYLSYILFGHSPKRWGTSKRLSDCFNFAEKTNYYRFYSISRFHKIVSGLTDGRVIERIPFAYSHIDGLAGYPLRLLGKNIVVGHALLESLDRLCRFTGFIPGGEFWLIKKTA